MAKFQHVASLLENRIRHGDYRLKEVPSERELADEVQVSHMTARKAILHLVDKGLLIRQPNKRLAVSRDLDGDTQQTQIALLAPAYPNPYLEQWNLWLSEMAKERGFFVRSIGYCHWDDAIIGDTISGFDGTFLMPLSDAMPEPLLQRIRTAGRPLVVFGSDMTSAGIPSLCLTSPSMVRRLLDYVGEMGHRHIDCLNTQVEGQVVCDRIDQWRLWLAAHNATGQLFDEPVVSYQSPMRAARTVTARLIDEGRLKRGGALFCVTTTTAIGAMRAIYEKGWVVGKDISVCSAEDGAEVAMHLTPALTCLQDRDPRPYLGVCLDWMLRGGRDWIGPLAVQPADAIVFPGESVARCQ